MSLSDLASLGSFVSGFAVLASLIYLALQVRQAEKNQRASIRQGRADRTTAIAMGAADPGLAEAVLKALTGAPDLTATQLVQFARYCAAIFNSQEDSFYQNREGLLTDSAFAAVVNAMERTYGLPAFRIQWKRQRTILGAEFVEFVDRVIARTSPIEQLSLFDPAAWLTDLAAERSGAPN